MSGEPWRHPCAGVLQGHVAAVAVEPGLRRDLRLHHLFFGHQLGAVFVRPAIDQPAGAHLLTDPVAGRSDHGRRVVDADRHYRAAHLRRAANLPPAPRGVSARLTSGEPIPATLRHTRDGFGIRIAVNRATVASSASGKYCQLGEIAAGSAVELIGTVVMPFGALRGRAELNPFENALSVWEAAQQHACTTYQTLLQTPLTLPAVGKLKHALRVLDGRRDAQPQ